MQSLTTRFIVLFAILFLLSIATWILHFDNLYESEFGAQSVAQIPVNIGPWSSKDVPLEEWVYKILETRAIIHRAYHSEYGNVFLSIVYYADTKVDFHTPEACLGAQGVELVKKNKRITLSDGSQINVNELEYENGNDSELVYYFYKSGSYMGRSYIKLRMNIAMNKLLSGPKSGALIRISTPMSDQSRNPAERVLAEFLNNLIPIARSLL